MTRQIALLYDVRLKRPACVLLQALAGGATYAMGDLGFEAQDWLTSPTPDMRLIAGSEDQWKAAARITAKGRPYSD